MVVDDHFVVRIGLTGSLNMEPDIAVVAEAATGEEAVPLFRRHKPDITLIDLRLPDMSGIELMQSLRKVSAEARLIMLSTYDGDEDIYRALQAGAWAYLLKSAQRDELLQAIRTVHAGGRYLPRDVAARLAERTTRPGLSSRELDVLQLIAKGRSNKEIASDLGIAEVTVKIHVGHILEKLLVSDRTQAVTSALQHGILHLD
jgi:DNA-binding NarL/FixJ family response regulator